jgi:hypothetical protein
MPTEIKASDIEAGHIAIATWNGKSGADFKTGVKHLYSDRYRELWPQDQYPEKYEEDVNCNAE